MDDEVRRSYHQIESPMLNAMPYIDNARGILPVGDALHKLCSAVVERLRPFL